MDAPWNGGVSCAICLVTVTLTLTSDLVFRIIVFGAYPILFELGIPKLMYGVRSVIGALCL